MITLYLYSRHLHKSTVPRPTRGGSLGECRSQRASPYQHALSQTPMKKRAAQSRCSNKERQCGSQSPSDCIVALVERVSITFAYPHVEIFNKIPMSEVTTSAMSSSAQTDLKRDSGAHNSPELCVSVRLIMIRLYLGEQLQIYTNIHNVYTGQFPTVKNGKTKTTNAGHQ
jgi:hypothetical protein